MPALRRGSSPDSQSRGVKPKLIYLGIKGAVVAKDADTGRQIWERPLKGNDFVNLVLDGDNLYAATHGEIFCLDSRSGAVRWHDPLKGRGWGLVGIAVEGAPTSAAPVLSAEKRRRDAQAAAAAGAAAG
jgi:outer membrane protein assembly factor BamB